MKHSTLLLACLLISAFSYGQTVSFKYDNAGNRTSRTTIVLKSTATAQEESTSSEPFTDQLGGHSILIYPNPVESELTVEIRGLEENSDAGISLFDQGGRLMMIKENLDHNNIIDLSNLSPGNYFMVIRLGSDNAKWTIVKE